MVQVLTSNNSMGHTELAIVQGGFGREYMVHGAQGVVRATLAFSCLVTPEAGDKVLINVAGKENHILAIVERPQSNDMKLGFSGNVSMEAASGDIKLTAAKSVSVVSGEQATIASADLKVSALKTQIHSDKMAVSGDELNSQWREITSVSQAVNMIVDRLTQRLKNCFKRVEGVEQKTSQNYLQTIDKTMSIRSRDAMVTARKDVKIDGERIHMG